jgi:hypothetical protein
MFLKAEQTGSAKWRVCAIPFGGEFKGGKDIDGEYFSPRTDPKPHWFKERPVLFHHGLDASLKTDDIGVQGEMVKEDDGWWGDVWLNRQSRFFAQIDRLLRAGKMYGSSGSAPNLVKIAADGEILVWPHLEQTLTLTPANRLARVTAQKAVDHFQSAGIELDPAIRGLLAELDSLSTDLASDLPLGGGDPAVSELVATLDHLDEVLRLVQ